MGKHQNAETDALPAVTVALHLIFIGGWLSHAITLKTFFLAYFYYWAVGIALSAGYHRLWAHNAFEAIAPLRFLLAFFGSGAFVGSIKRWAVVHRAHHRYLNTSKDPMNIEKGAMYAQFASTCCKHPKFAEIQSSDLKKDLVVKWQSKNYIWVSLFSGLVIPTAIAATWGDATGGFIYAGVARALLNQHALFLMYSIAQNVGWQNYSIGTKARSLNSVAILNFGEGYMNFHHEFPQDYRIGVRWWTFDVTKWLIWALSFFNITYNLHVTQRRDILRTRIVNKQRKLDRLKQTLDFGPEEESLPVITWDTIAKRVAKGEKLVVIDGIVHDVDKFLPDHPGGVKILAPRVGKDATIAFNGGLYRHSKAARNLAATMRVARLPKEEMLEKTQSDDFGERE